MKQLRLYLYGVWVCLYFGGGLHAHALSQGDPSPDGEAGRSGIPHIVKMHVGPIEMADPQGRMQSVHADIVVGEAEGLNQIEAAQGFLVRELEALPDAERRSAQVLMMKPAGADLGGESNQELERFAAALPVSFKAQLPEPPWYSNARARKIVFTMIRVLFNGGGTAYVYIHGKDYPLWMAVGGAGLAAVMSGVLQVYSIPFAKNFLDYPFLNKLTHLPSRQFPQPDASRFKQLLGKSIQFSEFWAKWYGVEATFIGITAAALVGMAAWIGFDLGPQFDSWGDIAGMALTTAVWSTAGQGAWDRFIINRFNRWTQVAQATSTSATPNYKAVAWTEGSFAMNSIVSVVLALTSMVGTDFSVVGLYAYAGTGIGALTIDWLRQPIAKWVTRVKTFFGGFFGRPSAASGCEKSLQKPNLEKNKELSWIGTLHSVSLC